MVRRASCGLQHQASAACHAAQARRRSLSLGRRRSTRACCARAPCRAGCGRSCTMKGALHRREASLLRRAAVVRRASCGLQRQASAACHAAQARRRFAVSGEEAQHSSLLRARAVPRWLWSDCAVRRALRRREASLLRRAAVVRRASCGLQRQAGCRVARATRACARCLWEEAQHSSLLRARAVPRWLWSARTA